jgi:exopolysaccharide biosynthesis polyprenyl glycosylphosphotransferase
MDNFRLQRLRLSISDRRSLLILGDFIVSIAALVVALIIWATGSDEWLGFSLAFFRERVALWFYLLPIAWILLLAEVYDVNRAANMQTTIQGVASAAGMGLMLYLVIYFASSNPLPRIGVAVFLIGSFLLTLLWRYVYIRVFTKTEFLRRVLIIGAGKAGQTILDILNEITPTPFNLIGLIDDDPEKLNMIVNGYLVIASSDQLFEILEKEQVSEIIVAISGEMKGSTFQTLLDVQESGVTITRMPVAYEQLLHRVPIKVLEADWILRSFVDQFRTDRFFAFTKRLMDIIGGLLGVLFLVVILPIVGLAIILDDGLPLFYTQTRLGRGGQPFNIIKFRTMRKDAEASGRPLLAKEDDERATRAGRILRKTHIDEIPQFINVLRGEMSVVGPRSERPSLVDHYHRRIPFYRARLLVKPGATGWAQVNFGYAGNIEDTIVKLEYDLYYIKHRSILLDILTILRTPGTMFGMRGQ